MIEVNTNYFIQSNAVGIMSVPPTQLLEDSFSSSVGMLTDTVVSIKSFSGLNEEAFQDYSGFFNVEKLLRLSSVSFHHRPETLVYGFYRGRKRITIEKLHLQPETKRYLGINSEEESHEHKPTSSLVCQSGPPSSDPLDF